MMKAQIKLTTEIIDLKNSVTSAQKKHTYQAHHYKDKLVQLLGDVQKNQGKLISEVTDQCEKKLAKKCNIVMNEFKAWYDVSK